MKTYRGHRDEQGIAVVTASKWGYQESAEWCYGPAEPLPLEPSLKIRDHSPCGFEWGYGGSGPAQLALAILLDYYIDSTACNPEGSAAKHYQDFKFEVIAKLPPSWELTSEQISKWLASKQPKLTPHPNFRFPAYLDRDDGLLEVEVGVVAYPARRGSRHSATGPTPDLPAELEVVEVKDRLGNPITITGEEGQALEDKAWAELPEWDEPY